MTRRVRGSRKLYKERINVRLTKESAEFLRNYSGKAGCTVSELVEDLVVDRREVAQTYFSKSAAYFAFINAAMSTLIISRLLEPDLTPIGSVELIKKDITARANDLFGERPPSPFLNNSHHTDDRLDVLFYTFNSHWMKNQGIVPNSSKVP